MLKGNGVEVPSFSKYQNRLEENINTQRHDVWKKSMKRYEIKHFNAINKELNALLGYNDNEHGHKEITDLKKICILIIGFFKSAYYKRKATKRFQTGF